MTARHVCEAPSGCWRQGVVEVKGRWLCAKHSRAETSPPPEPSLFDEPSSDELRDEAMDRVDRHAEDDWKDAAYRVGRSLSRSRSTFTSEAIMRAMEETGLTTHDSRALGPVMKRLARDGYIAPTDESVKGTRRSRHSAPLRVWRSIR